MNQPVREHASAFLASFNGSVPSSDLSTITDIAKELSRLASQDAPVQGALASIMAWPRSLTIAEGTQFIHQRLVHAGDQGPGFEVSPGWTAASLAYLAARKGAEDAVTLIADAGRFRDTVLSAPKQLASIEPDFMDELIVETAVRQTRDSDFRGLLTEGRFGLVALT